MKTLILVATLLTAALPASAGQITQILADPASSLTQLSFGGGSPEDFQPVLLSIQVDGYLVGVTITADPLQVLEILPALNALFLFSSVPIEVTTILTPEPATAVLLAGGLLGLAWVGKRRR